MKNIDFNKKVFGLGLTKTGTSSLAEALNILGIKSIHFPCDELTFVELKNGIYNLTILQEYQGANDISISPFYPQFDKIFPDSKFNLTIRDIDSWIESVRIHWKLPDGKGYYKDFLDFIKACTYGTIEFNEDRFRYVFETHNRNVCEYFSNRPNDFLILNISDNDQWNKLCKFLGKPKPNVPYPHLHTRDEIEKWIIKD